MAQPDISLLGATYSGVSGVTLPKSGGGTATFPWVEGSETKTANGTYDVTNLAELVVNVSGGGGGGAYAWFGDGAEKVATVINKAVNLSSDTSYDSWTASTSNTTIKAASSTPDYTLTDASGDYDYCFLTRWFCQPVYLAGTTLTTTAYRFCAYHAYAVYGFPDKSTISAMVAGSPIGSLTNTYNSSSSTFMHGYYYYNNAGNLTSYTTPYGPMFVTGGGQYSSSASNGKITMSIELPAIMARCNSSRFATSMKTKVDSANTYMYITTDLIRCPRGKSFGSAQFDMLRADLNA